MVMQEIYILTKHGNYDSEYVENIPVNKRRYYLELLREEIDTIKKEQEKSKTTVNRVSGRGRWLK
jgi:phage terminase Nu1 subunit (DNA packaging protein)